MPIKYSAAPSVEAIARGVIRDHHAHLLDNDAKVLFLFTDEPVKLRGADTLATARKIGGLSAYLAQFDVEEGEPLGWDGEIKDGFFLITVWEGWWRDRDTTDEQRRALVDHELAHLWSEEEVSRQSGCATGKILLSTRPHDLEEFNAVVSRHGAWRPDITAFLKAYKGSRADGATPSLFDVGEEKGANRGTQVTLTTRGGSVTLSSEDLRRQAERAQGRTG